MIPIEKPKVKINHHFILEHHFQLVMTLSIPRTPLHSVFLLHSQVQQASRIRSILSLHSHFGKSLIIIHWICLNWNIRWLNYFHHMFIFMLLFLFVCFFWRMWRIGLNWECTMPMRCPPDKTGSNNSMHSQFTLLTECFVLWCVYIAFVMKCANDFENSAISCVRALTPSLNRSIGRKLYLGWGYLVCT